MYLFIVRTVPKALYILTDIKHILLTYFNFKKKKKKNQKIKFTRTIR